MLYQIKNIQREDQDPIASENVPGDSNTVRVESHAGHWDSQHSKIRELDGDLRTDAQIPKQPGWGQYTRTVLQTGTQEKSRCVSMKRAQKHALESLESLYLLEESI